MVIFWSPKSIDSPGPPAKLGLWDEKAKGIKTDPLPGKGGKLPLGRLSWGPGMEPWRRAELNTFV